MGQKLNKSQRRAFAKILLHSFFILANLSSRARINEWFPEAMTNEEREELSKLNKMAHKLGERYQKMAWRMEGYDYEVGPPRRAK